MPSTKVLLPSSSCLTWAVPTVKLLPSTLSSLLLLKLRSFWVSLLSSSTTVSVLRLRRPVKPLLVARSFSWRTSVSTLRKRVPPRLMVKRSRLMPRRSRSSASPWLPLLMSTLTMPLVPLTVLTLPWSVLSSLNAPLVSSCKRNSNTLPRPSRTPLVLSSPSSVVPRSLIRSNWLKTCSTRSTPWLSVVVWLSPSRRLLITSR